jgi:hypothetical protein
VRVKHLHAVSDMDTWDSKSSSSDTRIKLNWLLAWPNWEATVVGREDFPQRILGDLRGYITE